MNGLEAAEHLLALEAALVEERNKTSASQRLAGFRNQLLLFIKESLIESEIPCGTGMCRPKSNNLAMT